MPPLKSVKPLIEEKPISSLSEFAKLVTELSEEAKGRLLYRGQRRTDTLLPVLFREWKSNFDTLE
jgi:hypothetical protein